MLDLVSRACYFLNREKMEFATCETEEKHKDCYDTYVRNCYDEYFNFSHEPGSKLYAKALETGTLFQFNPILSHTCLHHWRICKNWCTMFQELIDDQDLKISTEHFFTSDSVSTQKLLRAALFCATNEIFVDGFTPTNKFFAHKSPNAMF